jgi:uncharacterized DUF497 family protein
MKITFDPAKRAKTLAERGLDFADAAKVFAGPVVEDDDERRDYGERRVITFGVLYGRMVVVVWTPRGSGRRIISMRYASDREKARFGHRLG